MWVNGIYVVEELLAMFCLLDNKDVIYIPEPKPGCIGGSADGLGFELFCEQVGYLGLMGEPMAAPWTCSKYLPLKRK